MGRRYRDRHRPLFRPVLKFFWWEGRVPRFFFVIQNAAKSRQSSVQFLWYVFYVIRCEQRSVNTKPWTEKRKMIEYRSLGPTGIKKYTLSVSGRTKIQPYIYGLTWPCTDLYGSQCHLKLAALSTLHEVLDFVRHPETCRESSGFATRAHLQSPCLHCNHFVLKYPVCDNQSSMIEVSNDPFCERISRSHDTINHLLNLSWK